MKEIMAHWTDKENWINKKPDFPYDETGLTDGTGEKMSWKEFDALEARARQLSLRQLDALVYLVGVIVTKRPGEEYLEDEDYYIALLEEADDFQKIYDYLEQCGV